MTIRKGLFAFATTAAMALAARDAAASFVTVTVDGCKDGSNVHTTVSFNCNTGVLSVDGKGSKTSPLCGGIIFAATCPTPDLNCPGNVINDTPPCDTQTPGDTNGNPDGPPTQDIFPGDDGPKKCDTPDLKWNCNHDPCNPDVPAPPADPSSVTDSTPLPSSAWGAGMLLASLGLVHRMRRKAERAV